MVILLTGDDADLLFVVTYALRAGGYEVITAPIGEVAAARSRAGEEPAVIIVDDSGQSREIIAPPGRPAGRAGRRIPHILVTARTFDQTARGPTGWAAVLPKPFRIKDLARIIEALGVPEGGQELQSPELPGQPDIH